LHGFKELEEKLRKLPERVGGRVLKNSTRAGAAVIGKAARKLAPRADRVYTVRGGHKVEPGRLKKQIAWKETREGRFDKRKTVWAIKPYKKDGKTVYYWIFVELGTKKMPRQSFMRPAFAQNKQKAIDAMRDKLRAELLKIARKP
jgi:HK97 gp10 family phage protein